MNAGPQGRSLELFFVDGKPDGMLTAEVFNWTGHVLIAPRTQIHEALKRKEAGHTGIYILHGDKEGAPLAYIGEAEVLHQRIRSHVKNKDWWDTAVLVTSTADNLNKAHVKFLEARLLEKARSSQSVSLENEASPSAPGLSEAAVANMEVFLDYLYMVLPAVRVDMFMSNMRSEDFARDRQHHASDPIFELVVKKHGLRATAALIGGEFVVQQGSMARSRWSGSHNWDATYKQLHEKLIDLGILEKQDRQRVFTQSYAFSSPSAAAAVVTGRPANGRREWKLKGTSKSYHDWETDRVEKQLNLGA